MRHSSYEIVVDKRMLAYVEYKCLLPIPTRSSLWKPASSVVRKACEGCLVEAHAIAGAISHGMDLQGEGVVPPTALSSHPPSLVHEVADGNGVRRSLDRPAD